MKGKGLAEHQDVLSTKGKFSQNNGRRGMISIHELTK
jgi:hypothetical protein